MSKKSEEAEPRRRVEIRTMRHAHLGGRAIVAARRAEAKGRQGPKAPEVPYEVRLASTSEDLPRLLGFTASAELVQGLRILAQPEEAKFARGWLRELEGQSAPEIHVEDHRHKAEVSLPAVPEAIV